MEALTTERALAYLQTRSTTNGDSVLTHLTHLIQTIVDSRPQNAIDVLETSLLLKQTRLIVDEGPSLPRLWKEKNAADVKMFIELFSNYYVFETKITEDAQEETTDAEGEKNEKKHSWGRPHETIPPEKGGGANANVYWVCSKPGEKLYRLPDVTPLQIKIARSLKKFLTGNLNGEVSAYPPFPGVEENFLRAQIARISAATLVAPKGLFKVPEAEDEEEPASEIVRDDEWVSPTPAELGTLEAWVHKNPYINLQGRCSLYIPEKDAEEGQEADEEVEEDQKESLPTAEEQESIPERLASIDNDSNISWGLKPWSVTFSSSVPALKHQIVCVRSFLWPGAYAIATPSGFSNIYVGWGLKNVAYVPPAPPPVLKEYETNLVESTELPPLPIPEEPQAGEQEEGQAEDEQAEEEEDAD
ncbi:hypothetical protein O6H91_20G072700 [Diphasiastrum complanatum]|uniref:Uncharacterized protein n=1 Tax=Diphasiastrum complanatum TaxID=34168 RepID=A0ACC2ARU5_DIPCM|nr:hypothetical protein O6H91_20G072700 [Diphasiastrum complanatum]